MDYIYDEETYPNFYSCAIRRVSDKMLWTFEISDRKHEGVELYNLLVAIKNSNGRLVGFNNIGFDYPILHLLILAQGNISCTALYDKCQAIITSPNRFAHNVWESDWFIPQVDLFKIHHFDNAARSTSLKMLEFNMRSWTIQDLPFPPGTFLTDEQKDITLHYNIKDVDETLEFYNKSLPMIRMREELSEKYEKNFINHNDTKIGKDYFIMKLEEAMPGCCYDYSSGKREMRQTPRSQIHLNDAVFDYIQFTNPEFDRIKRWFQSQIITETKGVFTDLSCTVNDFQFDFGTGGIHGSVESTTIHSDDDYIIIDLDVKSYYPSLAIKNRCYPEHLSEVFCDIYEYLFNLRSQYGKDEPENAMLKLALNGVYGDSNNVYSPFYDPLYTMKITINGQLLLCLLAEHLMPIPDLQLIQVNTDGLTVRVRRDNEHLVTHVADWWQEFTQLTLERADYRSMFIRDVNNYIAVGVDSKVKRKGAYEYDVQWHQNHSQKVVAMAAEAALVYGASVEHYIRNHPCFMDFMLRTKAPRGSHIIWGDERQQRITRFYASTGGRPLEKVSPPPEGCPVGEYKRANGVSKPRWEMYRQESIRDHGEVLWHPDIHTKNKSVYKERREAICKGWLVQQCNNMDDATVPVNYEYYIKEARKLVDPLR